MHLKQVGAVSTVWKSVAFHQLFLIFGYLVAFSFLISSLLGFLRWVHVTSSGQRSHENIGHFWAKAFKWQSEWDLHELSFLLSQWLAAFQTVVATSISLVSKRQWRGKPSNDTYYTYRVSKTINICLFFKII